MRKPVKCEVFYIFMTKFKRIISMVILGAVVLYAGYLAGYWAKYHVFKYEFNPERLLKKDVFGGATPKETYEMFVTALRAGDIELAAKYFVLSKREEKLRQFQELRDKGELQKYIDDLPEWGEMEEEEFWQEHVRKYLYLVIIKKPIEFSDPLTGKKEMILPGEYKNSILFRVNSNANIWKIDIL